MADYLELYREIKELVEENKMLKERLVKEEFSLYNLNKEDFDRMFLTKIWGYNQEDIDAFWEYYNYLGTEEFETELDEVINEFIKNFNNYHIEDFKGLIKGKKKENEE